MHVLHVLLTVQELQCLVINIQDDSIKQREIRAFAFVESKQRPRLRRLEQRIELCVDAY